jgi:putative ABC transport system permease protein
MRWWHQFLFRLERIAHSREADQELEEEIRSHIELETQDNIARGMPAEEARRAARIRFGSATLAKEDSRAVWGLLWAEQLWQDLRCGARILAKSPGFTATAVVSLALGIGATTAVFSILDAIFLRPLPYPEPDRLVGIWERRLDMPEPDGWEMVSTPTFLDWKKQSQSYEDLHEVADAQSVFNGSERAEQVVVRHVSEGYFHMMGARACQGRLLTPDDYAPGQPRRTVISYPTWQRLFGSNPSIVGSTIRVSGSIYHVVGVMCPDYRPLFGEKVDFWIRNWMDKRELRMWWIVGRLRPGISIEKAQAELNVIEARLAQQYPEQKGYGARIQSLQAYLYGYRKNQFLTFFGTVVLVLLIACVNVANLLLERGTSRGKEMAVRVSLGAGRSRLVRQMLTESLLLSVLGTVLGLVLAYAGVRLAVYISPEYAIPRADEISINVRMLGFTVLLTVLSAWSFGLFPALRASKPELTEFLKEGRYGPVARLGGRRVQSVLVIGQIALSLLLLVGAGLAIQNTWHVLHASFGFDTDHVAQMTILLPRFEYMELIGDGSFARMKPKTALTIKSIEERLRAIPGVRAVSVTSSGVFSGCNGRPISAQGPPPRQDSGPVTCYEPVGPGYFGILEIPVLKGRVFTDWDSSNSPPVAVISQSVAGRFFPGQDPIGKIINIGIWESDDFERRQVVGVVADVRWSVNRDTHSAVYYPYSQLPAQFHWLYGDERLSLMFLARSAANPAALPRIMDRLVPEVTRDVVISTTETVDGTRRSASRSSRFFTWLLATFAGTALLLAAVGIFGVMSYEVAGRTHEIGIRMALGANPGDVLRLILRNGILMTSVGLAIGLGSSLALARFLESRLGELGATEVKPTDPATLAVVSLFLALVALLACYIPARRAARMDPTTSLRYE